jgi:hypothetical protein
MQISSSQQIYQDQDPIHQLLSFIFRSALRETFDSFEAHEKSNKK